MTRRTKALRVKSRVYCAGACSWNSCSKVASSSIHSSVPRTRTPNGTAWAWATRVIGMAAYSGQVSSCSKGSGCRGLGGRRILASLKKNNVNHYQTLSYVKGTHVERAGSFTFTKSGKMKRPTPDELEAADKH